MTHQVDSQYLIAPNTSNTTCDDELNLKDLLLSLWKSRRYIVTWIMVATFVITTIAACVLIFSKKQYTRRLSFKIDFNGAEKNQYPNGSNFSTEDIIAFPIISKVYDNNDLKKYIPVDRLRSALTVVQTNDKLQLLDKEYSAILDDKKLSVEQRQRLEEEYRNKKKSMILPFFKLILSGSKDVSRIPDILQDKVLMDILQTWSDYAEKVKGANIYQIPLITKNVLNKNDLDSQEYIVAIDILKDSVSRALQDVEKIWKIPGAANFRIKDSGISLLDIKYRLMDIDKFKISPLAGMLMLIAAGKNPELIEGYVDNRIFEIKSDEKLASDRERTYQSSLINYLPGNQSVSVDLGKTTNPNMGLSTLNSNMPAMIPQLGETFLNSIIKMAKENADSQFRQGLTEKLISEGLNKAELVSHLSYYENLLTRFGFNQEDNGKTSKIKITPDLKEKLKVFYTPNKIKTSIDDIYASVIQSIEEMDHIYYDMSKANLNPSSIMFTVTEPIYGSQDRSIPLTTIIKYSILSWVLATGAILVIVLIGNSIKSNGQLSEKGN